MKALLIATSLACMLSGTSALATNYEGFCTDPACVPFNPSNSYVVQFAVTTAQTNNASVGDTIGVERNTLGRCQVTIYNWEVVDDPVLNSSDLQYLYAECLNP
jgi:hypothetical protein